MSASPPLRVLLGCEWFVNYTAGLAGGLVAEGCAVTMLTRDHGLEFDGDVEEMRTAVARRLGRDDRHLTIPRRVRDLRGLPDLVRARRFVNEWDPDVVHVQDSLTHDLRLAVASGLPRRHYAITVHDAEPHPGDPTPSIRIRSVRRELRRRASLVFVHSEAVAAAVEAAGVRSSRVVVIPHGVEAFEPLPFPSTPRLLFFGRIVDYKGLDVLIEAMPRIWERMPEVELMVAGGGELPASPVFDDPRITVRNEHVPEADVPALFERSSWVMLPYREVSQSGVGAQARRYGRPIAASALDGLLELVDDETGVLFAPGDADALAGSMLEVLADSRVAEERGRAGAAASEGARWPAIAERTIEAYRRFLL